MSSLAQAATPPDGDIVIGETALVADPAGALYWPQESALVVADLHLEKGSSFAKRGILLPPYDTAATLARLALLIVAPLVIYLPTHLLLRALMPG